MTDGQFLWGLSGGVSVCALSGCFWFGLGVVAPASTSGGLSLTCSIVTQAAITGALLVSATRLRRRSGFRIADLRTTDATRRRETERIRAAFRWATIGQTLLVALGVWWCVQLNRRDLVFPWIGLVVSLHFIPLARAFHVRAYYATACAGAMISLAALVGLLPTSNLVAFGGAMAFVMWSSGVYLVSRADQIAAVALRQPWTAGSGSVG